MDRKEAKLTAPRELVVLVDEAGTPIGEKPKSDVHTSATPLHLAFSCYLLDDDGRLLVTRRSLSKLTWPGVWTNSFCGHPAPDEDFATAITRRAAQELGTQLTAVSITCELPKFSYTATDASGIVENEICPVFTARIAGPLNPSPDEVAEWEWISPDALLTAIEAAPFAFSPWLRKQLPELMRRDALSRKAHNA